MVRQLGKAADQGLAREHLGDVLRRVLRGLAALAHDRVAPVPRRRDRPLRSRRRPGPRDRRRSGIFFMIYTLTVVVWCDAGAYFAGRAYGRRKLAPKISPGKSVEGAIGGVFAGTLAGLSPRALFDVFWPGALAPARLGRGAGLRPADLAGRDRGRPGRVAAQARRRGQGRRHAAARLRRRARPHRLRPARHPGDVLPPARSSTSS